MSQPPPRLRMAGVSKRFGSVRALDDAALEVAPREVHGLLGGNGAGKTTLMNVLYGLYRADDGTLEIDGEPADIGSPRDAIALGVGMVHQTFLQVDTYTVAENIVLGTAGLGGLRLELGEPTERIRELSARFGLPVDPGAVVEDLPVGVRQRVEILKALYRGARVLILDEPTTNLTPQEVESLFVSIRSMVDDGMSVILITHKIRETMSICDRMTVMRDGATVATVEKTDTGPEQLAELMVGEETRADAAADAETAAAVAVAALGEPESVPLDARADRSGTELRVRARDLVVANDHGVEVLSGLAIDIAAGEVLGIAGVAGNGQVELAEAMAGVRELTAGSVRVDEEDLAGRPTAEWLRCGVVYVPEDRNRDGILPTRSITENLLLGSQRRPGVRTRGLIDWRRARRDAAGVIRTFSVRASGPSARAGDLSGGNVQRVILGRAFTRDPRVLILHNPTRGLDLRSTQFVYERLREATEAGCGVLLVSEDLDEVLAISDRILALASGVVTGSWERGQADPYEIGRCMTGLRQDEGGGAA